MTEESELFNTSLVKPKTINGNIENTVYVPPFYTDNISSKDTRSNKVLVKSNTEGDAKITMHANEQEDDVDWDKVWEIKVDKDTAQMSINNEFDRDNETNIETSTPVIEMNSIQVDKTTGNGEIIMNKPLLEKQGIPNGPYITLADSDNQILDGESIRNVGVFVQNPSSAYDLFTDAAANIFNKTLFPNLENGHGFDITIANVSSTNGNNLQIVPGNNVEFSPFAINTSVGDSTSITFRIVCTNPDNISAIIFRLEDQEFTDVDGY